MKQTHRYIHLFISLPLYSDGVGRTGAFIAIHAEMERMKAETVMDLFQFIKATRVQRDGMVSNKVTTASLLCEFRSCMGFVPYRTSMSSVIKFWPTFWMVSIHMPTSRMLYSKELDPSDFFYYHTNFHSDSCM